MSDPTHLVYLHELAVTDEIESASGDFVPAAGQAVIESDTGKQKVGDGVHALPDLDYVPSPGGGGGDSLPIADPTGVTIETADNPVTGEGTINVATFPADTVALAIKLEGDDFPRLLVLSDPALDGIYFGDGTYDPYNDGGPNISVTGADNKGFALHGSEVSAGGVILTNHDVVLGSVFGGVIFIDPNDGLSYRATLDSGALVFTEVT